MQNDFFEWDDDKADANYKKHGVSFEEACTAIFDDFAMTFQDDRKDYGEERYFTV
ncbi:MAG: BrnT family toxin, partial [Neisseriaceae bacterium]|nr:BrnT family toxin [Neisseriaceae bacterium]